MSLAADSTTQRAQGARVLRKVGYRISLCRFPALLFRTEHLHIMRSMLQYHTRKGRTHNPLVSVPKAAFPQAIAASPAVGRRDNPRTTQGTVDTNAHDTLPPPAVSPNSPSTPTLGDPWFEACGRRISRWLGINCNCYHARAAPKASFPFVDEIGTAASAWQDHLVGRAVPLPSVRHPSRVALRSTQIFAKFKWSFLREDFLSDCDGSDNIIAFCQIIFDPELFTTWKLCPLVRADKPRAQHFLPRQGTTNTIYTRNREWMGQCSLTPRHDATTEKMPPSFLAMCAYTLLR